MVGLREDEARVDSAWWNGVYRIFSFCWLLPLHCVTKKGAFCWLPFNY